MPDKLIHHKPSKKSWPYIVGDTLGYQVENYGWSGGSNDRTFRMLSEHILNTDTKNTYIVQWSFPHRTEYWSEKANMFLGIVPDFNTDFKNQNPNHESIVYSLEYYSKYQNDDVDNKKTLRYIWSVDSLCKQFGHELIQFMPIENEFDKLPDSFLDTKQILKLVKSKMHPTENGHRELAKYLQTKIVENNT